MASSREVTPKVNKSLQFLKTCNDYTTPLANRSLQAILNEVDITDRQKKRKKVLYLVSEGYGELFSTIWNALSGYMEKDKWGEDGFLNLRCLMCAYFRSCDCCPELCAELGNSGSISLLFACLNRLEAYLDNEEDFETIKEFMYHILLTLYHLILLCPKYLKIYREAQAFAILEKYMRRKDLSSLLSFMILAYVVDESERGILGTFDSGVDVIVHLLQEAVGSFGHIIMNGWLSARKLLDCLNRLAISDNSKRLIEKYYCIPAIVVMLGDDFSEEEQYVAAETVWNLAFVEDIRKSPQLQEARPCK